MLKNVQFSGRTKYTTITGLEVGEIIEIVEGDFKTIITKTTEGLDIKTKVVKDLATLERLFEEGVEDSSEWERNLNDFFPYTID